MTSPSKTATGGGIGLSGVLFVALLVLKLTVRQDLSWWVVLLPISIPVALLVLAIVFLLIAFAARRGK